MSAIVTLGAGVKQARAIAVSNYIDAGSNLAAPAKISFYTGLKPAAPEDPITDQTLLAQIDGPVPFADTVVAGQLTVGAMGDALGLAAGVATWARVQRGDNAAVFDGTVGLIGSGAVFELASVNFLPGILVSVSSGTLTEQ